jgi:hypothetical protein
MARRRPFNDAAWERLLAPATDEREMVRHYTLGADDLALVSAKRTEATQLGFAMMLLYLRHPGRACRWRVASCTDCRIRRATAWREQRCLRCLWSAR